MKSTTSLVLKADILIVDDVPDNIRFLANFLSDRSYNVRKATNGLIALEAVKALPPDLILLDIKMPEITGFEVCHRLKENPATATIPIIFLSAGNETLDKVKALQLGGADYITKPFQLEEVLARVETQLTIRALQKTLEQKNQELATALQELKHYQAQLVQQEKIAILKKIVMGLAHEVNNPLGFIFSNIEPAQVYSQQLLTLLDRYQQTCATVPDDLQTLLNEADLSFIATDLPSLLQSIKTGAIRIHEVMKALKNFTHFNEEGIKPIPIHDLLDSMLTLLQHRFDASLGQTAIQVTKQYGELPLIHCYPDQLGQALFNLLVNGLDAIEAKLNQNGYPANVLPQLTILTHLEDNHLVIHIQDNGIGIPPEHQSHLFEPFFTTKPAGQGFGLGLVTASRVIEELHHGYLAVHSTVGEGTEFISRFPMQSRTSD